MQVRIWLVSRPPPMASSAMVAPVALERCGQVVQERLVRRVADVLGSRRPQEFHVLSRSHDVHERGVALAAHRADVAEHGDSALVRARPSLSSEDEPPRPRTLSKGCRHAVSRLLARRGARVGVALCPSRRWLRTPQAWWPSRATRTRTPGGIVSSCLGSRIAERLSAPVLGCPTEGPPSVAEGGKATS